jgi:molybdate transport system ATP-binding protein
MILDLGPREEMRLRGSPYLQARWHDWEAWDSPMAEDWMEGCPEELLARLGLLPLKGRHLSQLSSGEFRKLRIAAALAQKPAELLLRNPYAGLDAASRHALKELLSGLEGVKVLEDAPAPPAPMPQLPQGPWLDPDAPELLASLRGLHVAYGGKPVFEGLDWELRRGERWRLAGPNGSGKSTLLALLQGDHPQAYSNDFTLFGRRRGEGESIWEIKSRIGSLSPELHAHFPKELSLEQSLLSGFFESMGLFRRPSQAQQDAARAWLEAFGLSSAAGEPFGSLPLGAQRLALLGRALVKRPALLLLDEPCQGLEASFRAQILSCLSKIAASREGAMLCVSHLDEELPEGIQKTLKLGDT